MKKHMMTRRLQPTNSHEAAYQAKHFVVLTSPKNLFLLGHQMPFNRLVKLLICHAIVHVLFLHDTADSPAEDTRLVFMISSYRPVCLSLCPAHKKSQGPWHLPWGGS